MRYLLLLTLPCILFSCGAEPSQQQRSEVVVDSIAEPLPAADTVETEDSLSNLITNKNVTERLLAYGKENPETIVKIHTDKGVIKVRLFEDTPLHRANFIMWAKLGCYDSSIFIRVHKNFMAQGGNTYDNDMADRRNKIGYYTIPAEISQKHFHKKGAVAAARSYEDNPDKRSDRCDFYFVEGTVFNDATLDKYEEENNYKYTAEQREYYKHQPGAAHIDGEHTVFGEIIEGYSVVPKLTSVAVNSRDWPIDDLFITKVEVIR